MNLDRRTLRKLVSVFIMIGMILSSFAGAGFSASDISGHWAEQQIKSWISQGIIKGYPDGTIRPDAPVTRAEFMSMVNKVYVLKETSSINFKDVPSTAWYASVVRIAFASGYISGYPDGTMHPDSPLSRYEAATIIMKINNLDGDPSWINSFTDWSLIPSWARDAVGAAYHQKIMTGYPNGSFGGTKNISRAEAVSSLTRSAALDMADKVYSQPGTHGGTTMETIKGNVIIKVSGVTLQNMTINGNLTVDSDVGAGDVTLKNVIIKGTTTLNGGGQNSVYLTDVVTTKAIVSKSSGTLRMVVSGDSHINQVIARSDLELEEKNLDGAGVDALTYETGQVSSIDVELVDTELDRVDMNVRDSSLTMNDSSVITRLIVSARDTVIRTEEGSIITTLVANGAVTVYGSGTITRAEVNVNGVSFEIKPKTVVVKSGISAPTYTNPSVQSFNPADGATKVALNSNIVITFTETLRNTDGTPLTNTNTDDLVTLRKSSSSGSSVAFDATVAVTGGKTVITVNPTEDFDTDQKYYVAVEDMENSDNERLSGDLSAVFTTVDSDVPRIVTFSPENGAEDVPLSSNIVITFSEVVRKTANTTLTNSNVDSQIVFRKTSASGTSVGFDGTVATVGNKTVITINPTSDLAGNTVYYAAVSGLEDDDDQAVTGTLNATFTTLKPTANALTGLTIAIGAQGDGGAVALSPAFSGGETDYTASVADSVTTVLVTPTAVSGNTAVVKLGTTVKANGIVNGLALGSNSITVTVSKSGATDIVYGITLTRADTTPPAYEGVALSPNKKLVTLTFTEDIVSNTGDLKASVTFAADGSTFVPLASNDTVAINGNTMLIDFAEPLTGASNVLALAASSVRDSDGNILASQIQTEMVSAQ